MMKHYLNNWRSAVPRSPRPDGIMTLVKTHKALLAVVGLIALGGTGAVLVNDIRATPSQLAAQQDTLAKYVPIINQNSERLRRVELMADSANQAARRTEQKVDILLCTASGEAWPNCVRNYRR